jgi:superfamily II DNA or RNA helicase
VILSPATPITKTIAGVTRSSDAVWCSFREHHDRFRQIVKDHSLRWSEMARAWRRAIKPELNGLPEHRAAELAAKLVNAGFVCEADDVVAGLVQSAGWEPEHKRWVRAIGGRFHLFWRGQSDGLYRRARMLPESAYDPDTTSVTVPPVYFAEVVGFADEHDFRLTEAAKELLDQARRDYTRLILPAAPLPEVRKKTKRAPMRFDAIRFADIVERQVETTTKLYPHQAAGVAKLLPLRVGALLMDMGTGKTRCAIELAAQRQQRISRVVWFTPVGLKRTVAEEIGKHTRGESVYVFGDETQAGELPPAFWNVVGIESMSSSDRVVLAAQELIDADSMVVVDESSYIKGHASLRSMRITELAERSRYRLILTGTPISQGVQDLYSQMRFLSPDLLGYGSFYAFANRHLEYSEKFPGLIVGSNGLDTIAERIGPYVYQVTKAECLDLPDKLYDQVFFDLTAEQWDAYGQAKTDILDSILDDKLPDYALFKLFTELQQIVSGFWNKDDSLVRFSHGRIAALATALQGIPEDAKVIVWCKFVESLRQIAAALPGSVLYYGEMDEAQRAVALDRFRGPDGRYLIATMATGGHGLTLNEAHYHVFYENEFKYAHRIQAEDRSHRIGQAHPVTYIDIVANAGIDRRIQDALRRKQNVLSAFRREVDRRKSIKSL